MALTTALEVRKSGGIDDVSAPRAFRYADDAELDDEVDRCIAWAVGWLKSRVATTYYTGSATSDTDRDQLFKGAEEDLTLYRLLPRLKVRKVLGTHQAFVQEDSSRFQELIDTELLSHVETAIAPYANVDLDDSGGTHSPPAIVATGVLDRTELISWPDQLAEALDQASGAIGVVP